MAGDLVERLEARAARLHASAAHAEGGADDWFVTMPPEVRDGWLADAALDEEAIAELTTLREKLAEAIADRNAHADHVLRIAREADEGMAALDEIDRCWEHVGLPDNRKHLSLDEQVASLMREADQDATRLTDELTTLRSKLKAAEEALGAADNELEWQENQGNGTLVTAAARRIVRAALPTLTKGRESNAARE